MREDLKWEGKEICVVGGGGEGGGGGGGQSNDSPARYRRERMATELDESRGI